MQITTSYSTQKQQAIATATGKNAPTTRTFEIEPLELSEKLRQKLQYKPGNFFFEIRGLDLSGQLRGRYQGASTGFGEFPLTYDDDEPLTAKTFEQLFAETEAKVVEARRQREISSLCARAEHAAQRVTEAEAKAEKASERAEKLEEMLQEVYRLNQQGGPGSRRAVRELIIQAVEVDEDKE
ncbi:MAG TPA: hypothetical protein VK619_10380 [Pyrinomonadaceae bacterium]|nr:hypothetical protein [Pyrinomonadaceae bacterium]